MSGAAAGQLVEVAAIALLALTTAVAGGGGGFDAVAFERLGEVLSPGAQVLAAGVEPVIRSALEADDDVSVVVGGVVVESKEVVTVAELMLEKVAHGKLEGAGVGAG